MRCVAPNTAKLNNNKSQLEIWNLGFGGCLTSHIHKTKEEEEEEEEEAD